MKITNLQKIEEATPPAAPRVALLQLGFRPFYLLGALFALLSVPLWLARYVGGWDGLPQAGMLWHMHEMVFGFAVAIVVGFLFTAARNWTGLWTPRGAHLGLVAALWIAGRAAMLLAPPLPAAVADLLFLPAAIAPLYRAMTRSGNRRNLPLLGLLALLWTADAGFHAAVLGWVHWPAGRAVEAALLVLTTLSTVMGGRVIPGFTANMAPGSKPLTRPMLDRAGIALIGAASLAWLADAPGPLTAALSVLAATVHLWRLAGWAPRRTTPYPLLWILHLAYAWIGIGILMLGASAVGLGSESSALHALAVGAMSSLILGMITRTALGHTGRPVRAGLGERAIFCLISAAALTRVGANLAPGHCFNALLVAAGACWSLAFLIYLIVYSPYLCRARLDGREG